MAATKAANAQRRARAGSRVASPSVEVPAQPKLLVSLLVWEGAAMAHSRWVEGCGHWDWLPPPPPPPPAHNYCRGATTTLRFQHQHQHQHGLRPLKFEQGCQATTDGPLKFKGDKRQVKNTSACMQTTSGGWPWGCGGILSPRLPMCPKANTIVEVRTI
jgi:hypothetical protein